MGDFTGDCGAEPRKLSEARQRSGLLGYATLVFFAAGGLVGALALGGLALWSYFAAADREVKNAAQGHAFLASLETSVAIFGFAMLSLLVAIVAFTVLLKGLADDVASARRGPIAPDAPP